MTASQNIDPAKMHQAATDASQLLKTLSHKDRMMVLCQLGQREHSVGELAELLDIPQSPLSQHLARMRNEGLVQTRRDAQTIFYSLACEKTSRIIGVMYELFCEQD
ncbi:MAG: metalloregulator ArsR/SmtB family transcription factor [Gammaproteobacteria bacterium]|nr:metalloregulator ArsR/SmtB family transcription factor [Gammaproteobacteria bacterium]